MLELIKQPWPWYVAGIIVGLTVPALLLLGNKKFGISSTLRHMCAACIPAKIPFFQYDWKKESWNLFFVFGITIGAFIGHTFLSNPETIVIKPDTIEDLKAIGVTQFNDLMPKDIFNWSNLLSLQGFVFIILGGFLVGFGTRYAGGCTSGHAIMGLSSLQWPSLVATISFMVGGLIMTHILLPLLINL
ncbi:MAG: YeeE/YedE family protein [Cytophagaceae bacterium]|nr:YeeE/YedE family protein [Cytophagaceae bacterium]